MREDGATRLLRLAARDCVAGARWLAMGGRLAGLRREAPHCAGTASPPLPRALLRGQRGAADDGMLVGGCVPIARSIQRRSNLGKAWRLKRACRAGGRGDEVASPRGARLRRRRAMARNGSLGRCAPNPPASAIRMTVGDIERGRPGGRPLVRFAEGTKLQLRPLSVPSGVRS